MKSSPSSSDHAGHGLVDSPYRAIHEAIDSVGEVGIKILFRRQHRPPGGYSGGTIIERTTHQGTVESYEVFNQGCQAAGR